MVNETVDLAGRLRWIIAIPLAAAISNSARGRALAFAVMQQIALMLHVLCPNGPVYRARALIEAQRGEMRNS
jgi:hypothetical protein